jgi:hypothetical protein
VFCVWFVSVLCLFLWYRKKEILTQPKKLVMEKQILNTKTIVRNGSHGWMAETVNTVDGVTWKIITLKNYSGAIVSSCQECKVKESGSFISTSFSMFQDKNFTLLKEVGRATEAKIKEIHTKALFIFDDKVRNGEIKGNKTPSFYVGQLFFMSGYGKESEKLALYDIDGDRGYYVNTSALVLGFVELNHLRPIEQRFGIGYYFNEGECITEDETANFVIEANAKAQKILKAQNDHKQNIEALTKEGLKKLFIPVGAVSVIVAELQKDESDIQTDYFNSRTVKTVYLAFSSSNRVNFKEMRKTASLWEETKDLDNSECEKREIYSMGAGSYLANSRYNGWHVRKIDLSDSIKNDMALGMSQNRFLIDSLNDSKKVEEDVKEDENKDALTLAGLEIVDYSERSIAVFGETKKYKELLKELGGRFNFRLTHPVSKEICPGWIFSVTNKNKVVKGLGL